MMAEDAGLVEAVAKKIHDADDDARTTWPDDANDDGHRGGDGYLRLCSPESAAVIRQQAEAAIRLVREHDAATQSQQCICLPLPEPVSDDCPQHGDNAARPRVRIPEVDPWNVHSELEEAALLIINAADYLKTNLDSSEGVHESKWLDSLMEAHGIVAGAGEQPALPRVPDGWRVRAGHYITDGGVKSLEWNDGGTWRQFSVLPKWLYDDLAAAQPAGDDAA